MQTPFSRRHFLATVPAAGVLAWHRAVAVPAEVPTSRKPAVPRFRLALNSATISGYKLPLAQQIALAAAAGFEGFEPWSFDLARADADGSLADCAKRCKDSGLAVAGTIAFAAWILDDPAERAKGLDQMKREMDIVARFGGSTIAACPAGAYEAPVLDLDRVAERYRAVLELGRKTGVVPQLEFWGGSANLSRLEQCVRVAAAAAHPDACILADAYHIYRGGSSPATLRLLGRNALRCFHVNDYPATPAREKLQDSDRVFPGEGIAPFDEIFQAFADNCVDIWLSLEVFNKKYWDRPALETAKLGFERMRKCTERIMINDQ